MRLLCVFDVRQVVTPTAGTILYANNAETFQCPPRDRKRDPGPTILHVEISPLQRTDPTTWEIFGYHVVNGTYEVRSPHACKTVGRAGPATRRSFVIQIGTATLLIDVSARKLWVIQIAGYIFSSYLIFNEIYFCSFLD